MANNTNWLNISPMSGGTGETSLSLTALTNSSLSAKTATITAKNTTYNVQDTTTVTIQGFVPTLTLSRSTLRFDSTGGTATFTVYSNTAWTITYPALVYSYSTSAGTGDTEVTVVLAPNPDEVAKIDTGIVKDTYNVNQLYLTIVQESFIVELSVEPDDDITFANTGSSTAITIDCNTDWDMECPAWVTPSVVSGTSGTTTVTFTAGQNGPNDRSGTITIYAGSKSVEINVFQPFYIPPYITVAPTAWTFNYTEDGKTFIVNSYPEWTAEVIATGETVWSTEIYMEATFVIPSAMTMSLYSSAGSLTRAYLGPVRIYGSSVTFASGGTYKIRYEITSGGTTPSLSGNTYLTDLHFTDNIGGIPAGAFSGCSSLSGIVCDCTTAPSISNDTFYGVATGGTLTHPDGSNYNTWLSPAPYFLGYYGWPGFSGKTYMLVEYNITSTSGNTKICTYPGYFSAITFENGESVPLGTGYTFSETGRKKLRFYPNTSTVSDSCFSDCTQIVSVELADITTEVGGCFQGCTSLSSVTLNNGIATIGNFSNLTALTGLVIPSSVRTIAGNQTFQGCSSLRSIDIPDSVISFSSISGFSYCTSLSSATVGSGITALAEGVFQNCSSLRTVTLSSSIKTLGAHCFEDCTSLQNISLSSVKTFGASCFKNCRSIGPQLVLSSVTFSDISCFEGCSGIEQLYIMGSISSLPGRTFNSCTSLENLYCDSALTSIGYRAFEGCGNLDRMTFASTRVPSLGNYAFSPPKYGTLYYREGVDFPSLKNWNSGGGIRPFRDWTFVPIQFDS